jgi:hypothetical protein
MPNRAEPWQPWLDLTWDDEDPDVDAREAAFWALLQVSMGAWARSTGREEVLKPRALN